MRKRTALAAALVVVACAVVGAVLWRRMDDSGQVRVGDAFGADEGSYQIALPTVRAGEDLWYLVPAPTNHSGKQVTLEAITPGTLPDGMTFVGARTFKKNDFVAGVPLTWDTGSGSAYDPAARPSQEFSGLTLKAGKSLPDDELIYLHVKVETSARPLESDGIKFLYSQAGRRFSQVINANLKLVEPSKRR
ncbi:hypothetical protein ACFV9C_36675 [Kribbella sp. NPDC059898]|uniref:hypothetical protein n=1 Tax=Kribbella sp. NPDC059898 TaxID=3346995 RepID=UPI003658A053